MDGISGNFELFDILGVFVVYRFVFLLFIIVYWKMVVSFVDEIKNVIFCEKF